MPDFLGLAPAIGDLIWTDRSYTINQRRYLSMEQTREKIFDRIVLGLLVVGLVGSAVALPLAGIWSIWFWGAVALLLSAIIAYIVRLYDQFVVAAYLLVVMLVVLVASLFRLTYPTSSFTPYLFIPIVTDYIPDCY